MGVVSVIACLLGGLPSLLGVPSLRGLPSLQSVAVVCPTISAAQES